MTITCEEEREQKNLKLEKGNRELHLGTGCQVKETGINPDFMILPSSKSNNKGQYVKEFKDSKIQDEVEKLRNYEAARDLNEAKIDNYFNTELKEQTEKLEKKTH